MPNIKVPEVEIFMIAQMIADGVTYTDIGKHYNLTRERIRQIAKKSMWLMDKPIQDLVKWLEDGDCIVNSTRKKNVLSVNGLRCKIFVNPHKGTIERNSMNRSTSSSTKVTAILSLSVTFLVVPKKLT